MTADGFIAPAPVTESSYLDRLDPNQPQYRDTPPSLGTEIPAGCPGCADKQAQLLRLAEIEEHLRGYLTRVVADLAAAERRNTAYRTRFGEVAG